MWSCFYLFLSGPPHPCHVIRGCCCACAPALLLWLRLSLCGRRLRTRNLSAPPPCPQAQWHVFIKRMGASPDEVYAKLRAKASDDVADLTRRACAEFGWGVCTQARLYLLPHAPDADEPPSADEEARAEELTRPHWGLARARIIPGSWLLAHVSLPAMAAGALCTHVFRHRLNTNFLTSPATLSFLLPLFRAGGAEKAADAGTFPVF